MSTPDAQPCKHPTIQTFRFADTGEPAGLWACADCRRKFAPLDVESAAEIERLRDELNLCCALKREYQQQAAGGIERLCEEIERLRADAARLEREVHNLNWALSTPGYEQMATPEDQAEHEAGQARVTAVLDRMAAAKAEHDAMEADAARYRWLLDESDWIGDRWRTVWGKWDGCDGKAGFDGAIDAAMRDAPNAGGNRRA